MSNFGMDELKLGDGVTTDGHKYFRKSKRGKREKNERKMQKRKKVF